METTAEDCEDVLVQENISMSDSDGLDSSYSDATSPQIERKVETEKKKETPASIEDSCKNMMEKVAEYLNGELSATSEDYKLLETLNKLSITKYEEMATSTHMLITNMEEINEQYQSLQSYLTQIDMLEGSVLKLEQTAYKLDAYSKQLEIKFKKLEKR